MMNKRIILLLLCCFASLAMTAQPGRFNQNNNRQRYYGLISDTMMGLPKDTFRLNVNTDAYKNYRWLNTDRNNNRLYLWDTVFYKFRHVGFDSIYVRTSTDSVFGRFYGGEVFLFRKDAGAGVYVDTIFSRNDTLIYNKNGAEFSVVKLTNSENVQDVLGLMVNSSLTYYDVPGRLTIADRDFGDIITSDSGTVWTIGEHAVSYDQIQNVSAPNRLLGRIYSTGSVEELSGADVMTMLDIFTDVANGIVPASGGGSSNFLRADGTWAAPPGGAGTDNTNLGSGYRLVVPSSQGIKSLFNGYAVLLDSTSNSNGITYKVDTSLIASQFDILYKLNTTDSSAMLTPYLRGATEGWGINITGSQHKTWEVDSSQVATQYDLTQLSFPDTHMGNTNLTQTAGRTYTGAGFDYYWDNIGNWEFAPASGADFRWYGNGTSTVEFDAQIFFVDIAGGAGNEFILQPSSVELYTAGGQDGYFRMFEDLNQADWEMGAAVGGNSSRILMNQGAGSRGIFITSDGTSESSQIDLAEGAINLFGENLIQVSSLDSILFDLEPSATKVPFRIYGLPITDTASMVVTAAWQPGENSIRLVLQDKSTLGGGTIPTLQEVFDQETGEAILDKADTINNGAFDFYVRSTTATTNGFRVLQRSTTGQASAIFSPTGISMEMADYSDFNETTYFNMTKGDNAGIWMYALDNDGRAKNLNLKIFPDSLYIHPNATDLFNFIVAGLPNKASLAGTDSILIHDINNKIWKVPSSAIGGGGGTVTDFIFTDGNGFDGTVSLSTSTPTLSLTTTVGNTQVMFSNNGAVTGSSDFKYISADNSIELGTGDVVAGYTDAIAMEGSIARGVGAIVFSTNARDSSNNTFMGGGQNTIIRTGAGGAATFMTDGVVYGGATYSFSANDANEIKGESASVFGFGNKISVQNGFLAGNTNNLGSLSGIGGLNSYTDSWMIGTNNESTGDRNGTLGYKITNTGQEAIILGMGVAAGNDLWNSVRRRFGVGFNSDSLTFIVEEATGAGTFGLVRVRGQLEVGSISQDDTETKIVVWNSTNKIFEWRDVTTIGSGSGVTTVGALDGGTEDANGANISGTTIYMQSATASFPGLVTTVAQTFAGDKTFNGRIEGNILDWNLQSVTTAAGTTTLTATSVYHTIFTGSTTQTIQLPDATTLTNGHRYKLTNNSTGTVSITNNGAGNVYELPGLTSIDIYLKDNGTSNGTWDWDYRGITYGSQGIRAEFQSSISFSGAGEVTDVMTFPNTSATIAATNIAQTWTAGIKPSFDANGTNADIRLIGNAGDPSSLQNGDIWYNSTTNKFRIRQNGVSSDMQDGAGSGSPGGSDKQVQYNNAGAFGGYAGLLVDQSGINTEIVQQSTTDVALRITAAASSAEDLLRIVNNGGTNMLQFSENSELIIGNISDAGQYSVQTVNGYYADAIDLNQSLLKGVISGAPTVTFGIGNNSGTQWDISTTNAPMNLQALGSAKHLYISTEQSNSYVRVRPAFSIMANFSTSGLTVGQDGVAARTFQILKTDAVTNAVTYLERQTYQSSGTVANGFGLGTEYELENASGTNRIVSTEEIIYTDATDASEDADYVLKLMAGGATAAEKFRVLSTGEIAVQLLNQDDAETRVVVWDNTSKKFEWRDASTLGGGSSTLAALTDVNLTSLATNEFLKWDGTDWINRTPANVRSDLSLVVGTNVQAYDADLDTWAGITPGTNVGTFLATPSSANLRAALTDESGTGEFLTTNGSAANLTSFPTLNQNTTGSAATLTTTRTIWGQNFNGSANVTGNLTIGTANLLDANGNEFIIFSTTASAVNEVTFANAATGNNPRWTASGGNTDVGIDWLVKGAGKFNFLASASGAAEIRLFEDSDNGSNYIGIIGQGTLGANRIITLPDATGTVLLNDNTATITGKSIDASQLTGSVATARLTNVKHIKAATISAPTASENVTLFFTNQAITITNVTGVMLGTSQDITLTINYGDSRATADGTIVASNQFNSSDGGYQTTGFGFTLNTTSIPAGTYVWLTTSATSGTINDLNISIEYNLQ